MKIIKDAEVRKNEILDAAEALFNINGYDNTTNYRSLVQSQVALCLLSKLSLKIIPLLTQQRLSNKYT